MAIGSVNYTGTVSRQFYAPKRQQNCYVQNNTVSPAFKGNADEICLNEDNNKSKFEIILDNRVKKGLNPEMAKELSKLYSPVIDIVLAKDNAGNNIFPNNILNSLYEQGFNLSNNFFGIPTLKNGDVVFFAKNDLVGDFCMNVNKTKAGIYELTVNSLDMLRNEGKTDAKESYKVYVPEGIVERSEYYYQKTEKTPFGLGTTKKNGFLSDIQ